MVEKILMSLVALPSNLSLRPNLGPRLCIAPGKSHQISSLVQIFFRLKKKIHVSARVQIGGQRGKRLEN